MAEFRTEVDIGNRAAQHCGAPRMDPTLGFTEDSKTASEIAFCYGKLRETLQQRRVWTFATRREVIRPLDTDTMLLAPSMWVETTTYFVGCVVADESNNLWISRIPNNLGNHPLNSLTWERYFGPLSVSLYDSAASYFAGELIYTAPGDGTSRTFVSLQDDNADNPSVATDWDSTTVFFKDQIATYSGTPYLSLIDLNINQRPDLMPAAWNSVATYTLGNTVAGSDNIIYSSLGSGNTGFDPSTDGGAHWLAIGLVPWTAAFVGGTGSRQWRQIGGAEFLMGVALARFNITYPVGTGPSSQLGTRNVFRLPSGFLRTAPQNPKTGINALGGPSGTNYNDWLVEGDYLITSDGGPIPLRFVASVTDVTRMHANFCELLACTIAEEVCEPITQSTAKLVAINAAKKKAEAAGIVDGIEDGYVDPPEDELISVRR